MSEAYTANLRALDSLNRRIENISNCRDAQQAALSDGAYAHKWRKVQQLKEDSEHRLDALKKEKQIREDFARLLRGTNQQEIMAKGKNLIDHLKKYPPYYGTFQESSDPCFRCGATLKKLRNPSFAIKKDVQGKKKRRKGRLALIKDARANAASMPTGDEKSRILKAADDFTRNMNAAEKAVLSRDVYHYTDDKIRAEGAPAGYLRGSENPEILRGYGISRERLEPKNCKFRAELYIPDPEVFGPDAKPVIVFKGTDLSCMEDCKADFEQAIGKTNEYYERAINIGKFLRKNTDGKFEGAGHSLGGGLASAVGVVTGCLITVFNPAGLHQNTVAPYIKDVSSDASSVSAFVVKGEILNSGQDAANSLGRKMVLSSAKSRLPFWSLLRLAPLMVGAELSSIPIQIGLRTNVPAGDGYKSPNIVVRHLMDTVIRSIEQEKRKDQSTLRQSLIQNKGVIYERQNVG